MNPDHALLRAWTGPISGSHTSPVSKLLDMQVVDVDRVSGRAALRLTVPPAMRQASGAPVGRAVAAMLDCALSFAALATLEPPDTMLTATPRIESVVRTSSTTFAARGVMIARNDATLFTRAPLHDESDRLVALASATRRLVAARPSRVSGSPARSARPC